MLRLFSWEKPETSWFSDGRKHPCVWTQVRKLPCFSKTRDFYQGGKQGFQIKTAQNEIHVKAERGNSRGRWAGNRLYVRASDKAPSSHRPPTQAQEQTVGGRSSGTPTPGKALVVSKPPTTVQPLGSLCGFSSCHQTRHAPAWPARGLITVPLGGRGSHCPGFPTKPPPQPCRGLHPPRPGGPGPALPTPQAYSVPRGPATPGGSAD